jgi:hypothetical protein
VTHYYAPHYHSAVLYTYTYTYTHNDPPRSKLLRAQTNAQLTDSHTTLSSKMSSQTDSKSRSILPSTSSTNTQAIPNGYPIRRLRPRSFPPLHSRSQDGHYPLYGYSVLARPGQVWCSRPLELDIWRIPTVGIRDGARVQCISSDRSRENPFYPWYVLFNV